MRKKLRYFPVIPLFCASLLLMSACATSSGPAPTSTAEPFSEAQKTEATAIPITYTDDFLLYEGNPTADGSKTFGLKTKDGAVILPAQYHEISIAENGTIFTSSDQGYEIFDPAGKQVGGAYDFIECASPGEDGIWVYRQASLIDMRAVPPYIASRQNATGATDVWLLDENGVATEQAPYHDMEIYEDSIAKSRDGILYFQYPDGKVEQFGNEIVATYFDGKYKVKNYYPGTHGELFGLFDRDEKQLAPFEYSTIIVPFEDRYILCRGDRGFLGGEQAFLYDDANQLLADNSNAFSFSVLPDGSYYGLSYVGSPYEDFIEAQILDQNGKPEPQGVYFVDKNGKRLSERYQFIESYGNAEMLADLAAQGGQSWILKETEEIAKLPPAVLEVINAGKPFFLCAAPDQTITAMPVSSMLIQ